MSGLKQQILKNKFTDKTEWGKIELITIQNVFRLLGGYDIYPKGERVCIPKNKLEELIRNRPQTAIVDFAKRGDVEEVEKEVSAILQWFEKLDKLLEESK